MPKTIFSTKQEKLQQLLRQVRLDAKLTQVELAKLINQPQSFVSKYESGERRLDLIELYCICEAIGIPIQEFIRRFGESLQ